MNIQITDNIHLELLSESHAPAIFEIVAANRNYLRTWLTWIDYAQTVDFIYNFAKGSMQRNKEGIEYSFVIMENKTVVGRIGIYKIDKQNKIGEIGYWIAENQQGRGLVTESCKALLLFCFDELNLNRIEIKCGTENLKSQKIPELLHFTKEGILRQAEWIQEKYIDLYIYSYLKKEFKLKP